MLLYLVIPSFTLSQSRGPQHSGEGSRGSDCLSLSLSHSHCVYCSAPFPYVLHILFSLIVCSVALSQSRGPQHSGEGSRGSEWTTFLASEHNSQPIISQETEEERDAAQEGSSDERGVRVCLLCAVT